MLSRENIKYCHWKSNEGLLHSLNGDADLDLLVDPQHRFIFSRILVELGFKQASISQDFRYPGIFNFYGHDLGSKKIVHVHVHYRLLIGCDLLKNYELPFIIPYLDSSRESYGFLRIPAIEFEYVVFVLRMVLKRRWVAWVLGHPDPRILLHTFSRRGRPPLKGSELREWRSFQPCVNRAKIHEVLSNHLPTVDFNLFERCEESLQLNAPRWAWLTAGMALCAALKPYQRYSTPLAAIHAFYRRCESLLPVLRRYLPFQSYRPRRRKLCAGGRVIAFVGGDGSGKTTNIESLQGWLGQTFDVQTFHLGKPPHGPVRLLYILISKAIRILIGNPREAAVPPLRAMRHLLIARGRWQLAKVALSAAKQGTIVLCDRFPLKELALSDGPLIPSYHDGSRLISWLARREQMYYDKIVSLGLPHDIIVLRIVPQAAIDRKTEENPDFIRPRLQEIWDASWKARGNSQVIDTNQSLENVLAEVRNGVWGRLPGWSPRIEIAGIAGAGKSTLANELFSRGVVDSGKVFPLKHPIRILKSAMCLWWFFLSCSWVEWMHMVLRNTKFDLRKREMTTQRSPRPVLFVQGPFYDNVVLLRKHSVFPQNRLWHSWNGYQMNFSRDILDVIIWLEVDNSILRNRINSRSRGHVIKGEPEEIQNKFLSNFRQSFNQIMGDDSDNPQFPLIKFRVDNLPPSKLADKILETIS